MVLMSLDSELGQCQAPEKSSTLAELCLHEKYLINKILQLLSGLAIKDWLGKLRTA